MPTTSTGSGAVVPPGAEAPLDLIRKDLAARLKTGTDTIRLVSAEAVDWGDSSLGCPKPGMAYAQVITPGFKFILSAGNSQYEYHSDRRAVIVSCP